MARLPLTLDDWGKKRVNNLTVTPPIILFFGIVRDKINTHKRKCGGGGGIIRIQLLRGKSWDVLENIYMTCKTKNSPNFPLRRGEDLMLNLQKG